MAEANPTTCPVVTKGRQCPQPIRANGLCVAHNRRMRVYGDVLADVPVATKLHWPDNLLRRLRFMPPTMMPAGCIIWTGPLSKGYGRVTRDGRITPAHRAAYETIRGPIPDGLVLDHLCHNADLACEETDLCPHRACVNTGHLEAVTQGENVRRGRHCR